MTAPSSIQTTQTTRRRVLVGGVALAGSSVLRVQARSPAHVAVIGAGMAGLYAALALQDAGFRVSVLEAQPRLGGRNWSVRAGDHISDTLGDTQRCTFSPGQYLNAGPWRILDSHRRVLRLVKRLGLTLEPVHAGAWQPAGGMDALPHALAAQLHAPVLTGYVIERIDRIRSASTAPGVRLIARRSDEFGHLNPGQPDELTADYALVALPLNQLPRITMALPAPLQRELTTLPTADALKIGLEISPGSATSDEAAPHLASDLPHTMLRILPPYGNSPHPHRIITVYANGQGIAQHLPGPRAAQISAAHTLAVAAGFATDRDSALAIHWSRIPFIGAAATHSPSSSNLKRWRAGLPPLFFASDALSALNGWQEGALESAEHAVAQLSLHWQHTHS